MTNIHQTAQRSLLDKLVAITRGNDGEALRCLLCGVGLPSLFPDVEPAQVIHEALCDSDSYNDWAKRIARLLAELIEQRADAYARQLQSMACGAVGGDSSFVTGDCFPDDEAYVFNLFLLAGRLPRETNLFNGLHRFHQIGFERRVILDSIDNRVGFQLLHSLAKQQFDTRLRDYWLGLLQQDRRADLTPARETELLEAWDGFLETLDFPKNRDEAASALDKGLRTFHDSVEPFPQGLELLQLAVWRLDSAIALDPSSWREILSPIWPAWPQLLQDVVVECWPSLWPQPREAMPALPDKLAQIWEKLAPQAQAAFLDILRRNAAEEAHQIVKKLLFQAPTVPGMAPKDVRIGLAELADHFWPKTSKAHTPAPHHEEDREDYWGSRRTGKGRASFDRIGHLEAVNRTLSEIEKRLEHGDEVHARRFLDELLEQQRAVPLASQNQHIAKTLAKAGTIAQRYGRLEWAEALLREACRENHDDNVSACGLAEVLKVRGDLDGAETQYRQNVARWPNDEVSLCGLAEVLKARGDLDGAETQYRQNVARWPNDEVSSNGLAEVLKARGDLDGAETQYRQNVARWPNNEVSACGLAEVLKARGDLDGAETQCRQNVARWPNSRVAVHGLASALRKKKRHDEALALLPAPKTTTLLAQDAYDLHLRAMILWEQRKFVEAREALELGARFVVGTDIRLFQSSLALLDLRSGELAQAEARLAEIPDNVVYLDLVRLDVAAAQAQRKAAELSDALISRLTLMNSGERLVFNLLRKDYALTSAGVGRQPTEIERDELFDAEIDMLLSA